MVRSELPIGLLVDLWLRGCAKHGCANMAVQMWINVYSRQSSRLEFSAFALRSSSAAKT